MSHRRAIACASVVLVLSACGTDKAPVDPAVLEAVQLRQGVYREIGSNFKNISDALKRGDTLDHALRSSAREIAVYSARQDELFAEGTGPQAGVKTDARAEIWANPVDFEAKNQSFITAAAALRTAADDGNHETFVERFAALGATCKSCHDVYRREK